MKLEEALLSVDRLYGDTDPEQYACRILRATGSYVVYQIVQSNGSIAHWCEIITNAKIDIQKLMDLLFQIVWDPLEALKVIDPVAYETDIWFVVTLPELRDINNILWTRNDPAYDTVSSS
jgi:hypothetical protein